MGASVTDSNTFHLLVRSLTLVVGSHLHFGLLSVTELGIAGGLLQGGKRTVCSRLLRLVSATSRRPSSLTFRAVRTTSFCLFVVVCSGMPGFRRPIPRNSDRTMFLILEDMVHVALAREDRGWAGFDPNYASGIGAHSSSNESGYDSVTDQDFASSVPSPRTYPGACEGGGGGGGGLGSGAACCGAGSAVVRVPTAVASAATTQEVSVSSSSEPEPKHVDVWRHRPKPAPAVFKPRASSDTEPEEPLVAAWVKSLPSLAPISPPL